MLTAKTSIHPDSSNYPLDEYKSSKFYCVGAIIALSIALIIFDICLAASLIRYGSIYNLYYQCNGNISGITFMIILMDLTPLICCCIGGIFVCVKKKKYLSNDMIHHLIDQMREIKTFSEFKYVLFPIFYEKSRESLGL
jgi:hypothetical protein